MLLKNGQPLSPVYAYRDSRTQAVIPEVQRPCAAYQPPAPNPALQQHLSAVCRQKAGRLAKPKTFLMIAISKAAETVRRESPRVHQCHLHRPWECPESTTRRFSKLWACRRRCSADGSRYGAGPVEGGYGRRGGRADQRCARHPRHRQRGRASPYEQGMRRSSLPAHGVCWGSSWQNPSPARRAAVQTLPTRAAWGTSAT